MVNGRHHTDAAPACQSARRIQFIAMAGEDGDLDDRCVYAEAGMDSGMHRFPLILSVLAVLALAFALPCRDAHLGSHGTVPESVRRVARIHDVTMVGKPVQ